MPTSFFMSYAWPRQPMEISIDWPVLIDKALEQARGHSQVPVPGAKLRKVLAELVSAQGQDLTTYLQTHGLSFSQLLDEQIRKGAALVLVRRIGTDMLVSKPGEHIPPESLQGTKGERLKVIRKDLYQALTDFSSGTRYFYNQENDEVVSVSKASVQDTNVALIELPPSSLEEQIQLRRRFAEGFPLHQLDLGNQTNALTQFKIQVHKLDLDKQWHEFKYDAMKTKLIEWASSNKITVNAGWFTDAIPRGHQKLSMAALLRNMADYMTEDELKELRLPLRVFFDFWVSQNRRKF